MNPVRVYSLPRDLSEEELATVFAKCARSPEPFDEIANTVTKEGASQFHEKYVVNYGHASVAESAIPNICFEGVSILASKMLESMPRGAYQEKSTRAQNFLFKDANGRYTAYYVPMVLSPSERQLYIESQEDLFSTYEQLMEPMQLYAQEVTGNDKFVAKRRAFDSLRYLLPIGTQTNLGMRMNARDLAVLIVKMLSSEIPEFRELGNVLKNTMVSQLPTLLRHTDPNKYISDLRKMGLHFQSQMCEAVVTSIPLRSGVEMRYLMQEHDAIQLVARTFMAQYGTDLLNPTWGDDQCRELVTLMLQLRGKHDHVPTALAVVPTYWDMVIDYGAFRDLQRHRRCSQFPQHPSVDMGYDTPEDIINAGLETKYKEAVEKAADNSNKMKKMCPDKYAHLYMIPLAFRHRMIVMSNLEQDFYVIELRSRPQGHISYRTMANSMFEWLQKVYPVFAKHIRCVKV